MNNSVVCARISILNCVLTVVDVYKEEIEKVYRGLFDTIVIENVYGNSGDELIDMIITKSRLKENSYYII